MSQSAGTTQSWSVMATNGARVHATPMLRAMDCGVCCSSLITLTVGKFCCTRSAVPLAELSTTTISRSAIPCWASKECKQRLIQRSDLNEATTTAQDSLESGARSPESFKKKGAGVGGRESECVFLLLSDNQIHTSGQFQAADLHSQLSLRYSR